MSTLERALCQAIGVCAATLALAGAAPLAAAAECAQITTWSSADAAAFPVERTTRIDSSNKPGLYYFDVDNAQEKTLQVTYFALTATPSKVSDQRFANAVSVSLMSFRSEADALTMYGREVAKFNSINPYRWNFKLLSVLEGTEFGYYSDAPGQQQLNYVGTRHNTIVRITLKSASTTEQMLTTGVAELAARLVQARTLVDQKCNINAAPSVWLSVGGNGSFATEFQQQMAGGDITIKASDGDGADELDWGSFKVLVAGIDKTTVAMQAIGRLAQQGRVTYARESNTTVSYKLGVHPSQLMDTHNVFNIAWNGEWPVELRICDRRGACGASSYKLNFGPYVNVERFYDHRCTSGGRDPVIELGLAWGNNGYPAASNFYLVLGDDNLPWQSWTSDFWSLSLEEPVALGRLTWLDAGAGMRSVFPTSPAFLQTGASDRGSFEVPATASGSGGNRAAMPGGERTLAAGAVDASQGWYRVEIVHVLLCASK